MAITERGKRAAELAWQAFQKAITDRGGVVVEPTWLGAYSAHRVICRDGHKYAPQPRIVRQGGGACLVCAKTGRQEAHWAAFRSRVEALGGVVVEPVWLGLHKAHRVRCSAGHAGRPTPHNALGGRGICNTCAGKDSATAEAAFRQTVTEGGGVVLEPVWLGSGTPHRVRCAKGHEDLKRPNHVQKGRNICRFCSGSSWDAFYVVANDADGHVKFGITSGDPRPRLADHARDGYTNVVRLLTGLPGSVAPDMERSVKSALHLAGELPVRGREYFHLRALATILDVADHFAAAVPASRQAEQTQLF